MDLDNVMLVTHRGCMDGSTASIVFITAGGKLKNIRYSSPSQDDVDEVVEDLYQNCNKDILIADVSISLNLANKLDVFGGDRIFVLDHHKTAIPLAKFSWCEIDIDNQRAGGKMIYDFFMNHNDISKERKIKIKQLEDLVAAADDHDRWIHNIPICQDLSMLHNLIKQLNFVNRFVSNPELQFSVEENFLIKTEKINRDGFVRQKKASCVVFDKTIDGHTVRIGMVEASNHQSELGNAICADPKLNVDIAVLISARSISMRAASDCSVDLSKVAKLNGGGGHSKASGMSLDKVLQESFTEMVFAKIQFE